MHMVGRDAGLSCLRVWGSKFGQTHDSDPLVILTGKIIRQKFATWHSLSMVR